MKVAHNHVSLKTKHSYQTNRGTDSDALINDQGESLDSTEIKHTLKAEINTKLDALHKRFSLQSRLRKMAQGSLHHAQSNGLKLNGLKLNGLKLNGLKDQAFLPKATLFPSATDLYSLECCLNDEISSEEIPKITGDQEQDVKLFAFALSISRLSGQPVYVSNLGDQLAQFTQKKQPSSFLDSPTSNDLHLSFDRFLSKPSPIDLSTQSFHFEFALDTDATLDESPLLDQQGGILVLNQEEVIGAVSGDVLADLAKLDQDGNQRIDQNDEAYQRLKVWAWNQKGEARLLGLMEVGVNALYLGAVETESTQNLSTQSSITEDLSTQNTSTQSSISEDLSSQNSSTQSSSTQNSSTQNSSTQQKALRVYLKNSSEVGHIHKVDVAL